jgi:hypothetical protein
MLLMYLPLVIYSASMQMFLDGLQSPDATRVYERDSGSSDERQRDACASTNAT